MSKTRNLSDLLDANGDIKSTALDNVPASDVVNDTTPQLGGNLSTNGNDINFGDNDKANFGASNDLEIYHSGTHSYIQDNGNGDLFIRASDNLTLQQGDGASGWQNAIRTTDNADVALYYQGNEKLTTTSTGVDVTGTVTADGVSLGDSEYIQLGASNDLQIYHDGSNSFIQDAGTGSLVLQGTNLLIRTNNGDNVITATENAEVTLAYDNATKLQTTSSGATVTGTLTATAFSGDGSALTNLPASTPSDGSITFAKLSGSSTESINVQKRVAKVWVNFNASSDAIRQDYNVSSITNVSTGRNRINFTSSLADTNYCCSGMAQVSSNDGGVCMVAYTSDYHGSAVATSSVRVDTTTAENSSNDAPICCVMIMR